ncbi:hypothetical protein [Catenulispora pinisilvae]|uniref:hypothetical protein n=1 Tax=Catenulispora pinisilvae TaxID=2705253 RepID=UPI00189260F3|nr:hypothetical protein [Catenulispora pinisilvae]
MNPEQHPDLTAEMRRAIRRAARHGIDLTPESFDVIDGELCLDGMEPGEWIEAATMD